MQYHTVGIFAIGATGGTFADQRWYIKVMEAIKIYGKKLSKILQLKLLTIAFLHKRAFISFNGRR